METIGEKKIYVTTGLITAKVVFQDQETCDIVSAVFAGVPKGSLAGGFDFSDNPEASTVHFSLFIENCSSVPVLVKNANEFHLKTDLNKKPLFSNIPYIIYTIGEYYRATILHSFTVHGAAAVSPTGKGVLILGDKGSGKTSTLLALARMHGYKIIGNDGVILGENVSENSLTLLSGTKILNIRRMVMEQLNLDLTENKKSVSSLVSGHKREEKLSVMPAELCLQTMNSPVSLDLVIRVDINADVESIVSSIPNPKLEVLRLYQNTIKHISGASTPLFFDENGVYGYFPPIFDGKVNDILTAIITNIVRNVKFKYMSASSAALLPDLISKELV